MPHYCINRNKHNGNHTIHRIGAFFGPDGDLRICPSFPNPENQVALGYSFNRDWAVRSVTAQGVKAKACGQCCAESLPKLW